MPRKLFLFFLFGIISFFSFSQTSYAQTSGVDITVSPTVFDLTNLPNSTIHSKFRIRNNTDTLARFAISVGKLIPNNNYNSIVPADPTLADAFIRWMHIDQASISAQPKEWTDVTFSIVIPHDAAFGYYYAIRVKQIPDAQTQTSSGSKLLGEVVIPVLLTVKKDGAVAQATIVNFQPTTFINEYVPVQFTTVVKNVGNIHVHPRGNIFITNAQESNLATLDVNSTEGNILPGGTRTFTSSWDDGFLAMEPVMEDGLVQLDKNSKPVYHLVVNWNNITHFRIGKYSANLLLVYDNGTRDVPIEASTTFWIIPYTIIGIGLAGVVILVFGTRFLVTWYIKNEVQKYQKKQQGH